MHLPHGFCTRLAAALAGWIWIATCIPFASITRLLPLDCVQSDTKVCNGVDCLTAAVHDRLESKEIEETLMQMRASNTCLRAADDELIATLPQYKTAPRSLQEWTDWGAYDMFGITSDERSRGTLVSHEALHVPGECLERLRRDSLRSACAREQGITSLTVHDLVCALLWTMRQATLCISRMCYTACDIASPSSSPCICCRCSLSLQAAMGHPCGSTICCFIRS